MKKLSESERLQELSIIAHLDKIKGFGPTKFRQIYKAYKSFTHFWQDTFDEKNDLRSYQKTQVSIDKKFLQEIRSNKEKLGESQNFILEQTKKANTLDGKLITYFDDEYPVNLFETNQCVPILYASGNTALLKLCNACAVVGTRKPTNWSISQTQQAVKNLVRKNFVIVSGLALGTDAVAHQTALDAYGKTIAVLGCGLDVYYPKENKSLQDEIRRKGLLVSEYPFGARIQPISLQKRDKIIVGLSRNTLIVETSQKGGTMNAYRAILEQKKGVGVFDPPNNVVGSFDGNKKIIEEEKTKVLRFLDGSSVNFEASLEC